MKPPWTQEELAKLASRELRKDGAGERALSERTLRFYRAQALLDPPIAWEGRKPLFGEAHLRQVIDIRRLQARGMSLEQVRGWLARQASGHPPGDEGQQLQYSRDPDRGLRRRQERAWARPLMDESKQLPAMDQAFRDAAAEEFAQGEAKPESAPPAVSRLGPGLYLLIDPREGLDAEIVAAALSRAGQVLRQELLRAGNTPEDA